MERHKISKLLNNSTVSQFVTWIAVNDLSGSQYSADRFKPPMLRSDLCDYSDAYIVVKGRINVRAAANTAVSKKDAAFNTTISSYITKINNTLIQRAEDLYIVIEMHNLLEYSHNYSMTSGSLWKLMVLMIILQMVNHLII